MKLIRLEVTQFGKLRQTQLELTPGLQVYTAENEQGKTTLLRLLKGLFYGLGHKTQRLDSTRERYLPWQGDKRWGGQVVFEQDGRRYRLIREFGETASRDQIELLDDLTGQPLAKPWTKDQQPGDYFLDLDAAAFSLSTYLAQPTGTATTTEAPSSLATRLQALIGERDDGQSYDLVKKRLDDARRLLEGSKTDSIKAQLSQLEALQTEWQQQQMIRSEVLSAIQTLEALKQQKERQRTQREQMQSKLQEMGQLGRELLHYQNEQSKLLSLLELEKTKDQLDRSLVETIGQTEISTERTTLLRDAGQKLAEILEEDAEKTRSRKWEAQQSQELTQQLLDAHIAPEEIAEALRAMQIQDAGAQVAERAMQTRDAEAQVDDCAMQTRDAEAQAVGAIPVEKADAERTILPLKACQDYEEVQERARAAEKSKETWMQLLTLHDQLATFRREANEWLDQAHQTQAALIACDEAKSQALQALEQASISCRRHEMAVAEQKTNCLQQAEQLEKRRIDREQEWLKRQAAYLKKLKYLVILAGTGLMTGLICLILGLGPWLPSGWQQPFQLLGLIFAILGAGAAVHRSIFPPQKPQVVREVDAAQRLQENEAQLKALEEAYQAKLENYQQKNRALVEVEVEKGRLSGQLANIEKQQETAIQAAETCAGTLAALEAAYSERPDRNRIETAIKAAEDAYEKAQTALNQFREKRGLHQANDYPEWKARVLNALTQLHKSQKRQNQAEAEQINWRQQKQAEWEDFAQTLCAHLPGLHQPATFPVEAKTEDSRLDSPQDSWVEDLKSWQVACEGLQLKIIEILQKKESILQDLKLKYQQVPYATSEIGKQLLEKTRQNRLEALKKLKAPFESPESWNEEGHEEWMRNDQEQFNQMTAEWDRLQEEIHRYDTTIQTRLSGLRPEHQVQREKNLAEATLQQKQAYLEAIKLALKWLEQADEDLQQMLTPQVNEKASLYLKALTSQNYQRIRVNKTLDMALEDGDQRPRAAQFFSAGTYDQAELAVRLAVTELLDPEKKLPLLLDDPMVNYDSPRALAAYRLLAKLGREGRQILLMTCRPKPEELDPDQEEMTWQKWNP